MPHIHSTLRSSRSVLRVMPNAAATSVMAIPSCSRRYGHQAEQPADLGLGGHAAATESATAFRPSHDQFAQLDRLEHEHVGGVLGDLLGERRTGR